jgi:hypothetical protein
MARMPTSPRHVVPSEQDIRTRAQELRANGCSPKVIARMLGLRPSDAAQLVRELAAESPARAPELVGCWVSPGWSAGLRFDSRPDWRDIDVPDDASPDPAATSLACVLVARRDHRHRLSACGYLVDTGCLGIKNTVGPRAMTDRRLPEFVRIFFSAYDLPPLEAPLELAHHLVYGAEEYARGLGFDPHPDYAAAKGNLGEWTGPSAITFGRNGKPFYFQGPYDDSASILRTLDRTVGHGRYDYALVMDLRTSSRSERLALASR